MSNTIGPLKYSIKSVFNIFKNLKGVINDKKKLMLVIGLSIIWTALIVLPYLGVTGAPIRYLSFLTFARGGMDQGISNIVGGTIGKTLYAYFITSLIMPVFSGKSPFKGIGGGIKTLFSSYFNKDSKDLSPILLGIGVALILYNFFTGNGAMINSMAGVMGFVLTLRALSSKSGFLRGFITLIVNKHSVNNKMDNSYVNKVIAGLASGFALTIPLSTIGFRFTSYIVGMSFFAFAIILKVIQGKGKGVEKA